MTIKYIENIRCSNDNEDTMKLDFSPNEITTIKYAPITFCDV